MRFPKAAFPEREAYLDAFARLVWTLYGGRSLEDVGRRAAMETRLASADTFIRMIHPTQRTQKPDAYIVDYVRQVAQTRGVRIPAELMATI